MIKFKLNKRFKKVIKDSDYINEKNNTDVIYNDLVRLLCESVIVFVNKEYLIMRKKLEEENNNNNIFLDEFTSKYLDSLYERMHREFGYSFYEISICAFKYRCEIKREITEEDLKELIKQNI